MPTAHLPHAVCMALIGLTFSSPASVADAAGPATAPTIVMRRHVLVDKGMGGMKSHTVLAPDGWKVEGGAWWPGPGFFKILPSQDVKVIAPDGRLVHVGPSLSAVDYRPSPYAQQHLGQQRPREQSADQGNIVLYMPDNPEQWKTFALEKAFKPSFPKATNMRLDRVVTIPELTTVLQKQLEPIRQTQAQSARQAQALGIRQSSFCDGAVLAATCFYEDGGKKWEHLLVFATAQFGLDSDVGRQIFWSIEPSVSYRAEAGELDASMPLLMAIANSVRPTPEWAQMKADHAAKMNQIAAKGAADRADIIARSNREISRTINDAYRARSESQDRTHAAFIKSIREVEDYAVPGGEATVQLPNHYGHVFTNKSGEYLLTDDSNFDPNIDPLFKDKSWESMQPANR